MSEAPTPQLTPFEYTNSVDKEGRRVIPVVRAADFVRLAPNSFNAWFNADAEPQFDLFFQKMESAESYYHLKDDVDIRDAQAVKKKLTLQITELAAMSLSLQQIRALKQQIDGVLALAAAHQRG